MTHKNLIVLSELMAYPAPGHLRDAMCHFDDETDGSFFHSSTWSVLFQDPVNKGSLLVLGLLGLATGILRR